MCGETGVLVVGFVHVHCGGGSSIFQLWTVCGVFPRDLVTEHRSDGEAAPRHGPKWLASAARANSADRVDSAHHLVRGAGEAKSVWESRGSSTELRLTAWFIGEVIRHPCQKNDG